MNHASNHNHLGGFSPDCPNCNPLDSIQQTTPLADVEEDKHSVSPKPNTPLADRASSERQLTGLLPCPFCGYDDVELVATPDDDGAYEVLCQTVGCGGRSGDFYDKGKVIKQWNTRYSDASKEIVMDRQFIAGAQFGWNCGITNSRDKFDNAMKGRREEIHSALISQQETK